MLGRANPGVLGEGTSINGLSDQISLPTWASMACFRPSFSYASGDPEGLEMMRAWSEF